MLIAGVMRFNAEGRVLISVGNPVVGFNGGTPVDEDGFVVTSVPPPDAYLGGLGYLESDDICARSSLPAFFSGPFAMDSAGALALALTEPISHYVAGIPFVADGRVAVAFSGPPDFHAFDSGFNQQAFD